MSKQITRFFSYYRPYKKLFLLDFTCAVFAGLLELAFPVAVNQVIDKIMPKGEFRTILLACFALLLFYVLNTVLQYIVVFFGHKRGSSSAA
jgi:ATP-binding cassette subfamily B protein